MHSFDLLLTLTGGLGAALAGGYLTHRLCRARLPRRLERRRRRPSSSTSPMALGAFRAGMVVGRSEFSVRAASEALPMRDAFAVLFFFVSGRPGGRGASSPPWPRPCRSSTGRSSSVTGRWDEPSRGCGTGAHRIGTAAPRCHAGADRARTRPVHAELS
jgi:hypothetical protein